MAPDQTPGWGQPSTPRYPRLSPAPAVPRRPHIPGPLHSRVVAPTEAIIISLTPPGLKLPGVSAVSTPAIEGDHVPPVRVRLGALLERNASIAAALCHRQCLRRRSRRRVRAETRYSSDRCPPAAVEVDYYPCRPRRSPEGLSPSPPPFRRAGPTSARPVRSAGRRGFLRPAARSSRSGCEPARRPRPDGMRAPSPSCCRTSTPRPVERTLTNHPERPLPRNGLSSPPRLPNKVRVIGGHGGICNAPTAPPNRPDLQRVEAARPARMYSIPSPSNQPLCTAAADRYRRGPPSRLRKSRHQDHRHLRHRAYTVPVADHGLLTGVMIHAITTPHSVRAKASTTHKTPVVAYRGRPPRATYLLGA